MALVRSLGSDTFSSFSTDDLTRAEQFYGGVLGLRTERPAGSQGLLRLHVEGGDVLVYERPGHVPAVFTVLSFRVPDVERAVDDLAAAGVEPQRYPGLPADPRGINRRGGPLIAWFTDPAGNVLAVLQDAPEGLDRRADADAARGYVLVRELDAPCDRVWRALSTADGFGRWFGAPAATWDGLQVDARPGGTWSGTMVLPDGSRLPWSGRYVEVEDQERLVTAFADTPQLDGDTDLLSMTLGDAGEGRTRLVLVQTGGHLTDEQYGEARAGASGFVDVLAELVREPAR